MKNIIDFIDYESLYNRSCEIESDNKALNSIIDNAIIKEALKLYQIQTETTSEKTDNNPFEYEENTSAESEQRYRE